MNEYGKTDTPHQIVANTYSFTKTTLMFSSKLILPAAIIAFLVMVGYCIAKSIQSSNTVGLILALVSLGAGIYFIYLLQQLHADQEQGETA